MAHRPSWEYHPRNLAGAWRAIEELRGRVDDMRIADEVAEKVTEAIESHRTLTFSWLQKVGGALVGLVALADLALQIASMK